MTETPKKHRTLFAISFLLCVPSMLTAQQEVEEPNKSTLVLIEEIDRVPIQKDEFESNSAWMERLRQVARTYSGSVFVFDVSFPCSTQLKTGLGESVSMVSFDAETSNIVIAMPFDSQLEYVRTRRGGLQGANIVYHFLPLKVDVERGSYSAQNAFGATVEVSESRTSEVGLALLATSASKDKERPWLSFDVRDYVQRMLSAPKLTIAAAPDRAREILRQECLVSMTVRSALSDAFEVVAVVNSDRKSMLWVDLDEYEPTVSRPFHFVEERKALPVKLIALSLFSKGEKVGGFQIP